MARASYIYVVFTGSDVCAAFTVRHECESWLRRQPTYIVGMMYVQRHQDGAQTNLNTFRCSAVQFLDGAK